MPRQATGALFRQCTDCGQTLPRDEFRLFKDGDTVRAKASCRACERKSNSEYRARYRREHRDELSAREHERRLAKRAAAGIVEAPTHLCEGSCGRQIRGKGPMCLPCRRDRFDMQALEGEERQRRLSAQRLVREYEAGKILGILWINPYEAWAMTGRCRDCNKPGWGNGLFPCCCYECSTGRERTILRIDERAPAAG